MNRDFELLKKRSRVDKIPQGWRLTSVGSGCDVRNEHRTPISSDERAASPGEYPYYGPTGILDHISEFRYAGRFALIGEDGDHFIKHVEKDQTLLVEGKFSVNNHAHVIADTPDCSAEWFAWYFRHRSLRDLLTRQGANRYKLTKEALQSLPILLPPVVEQRRITRVLRTWDKAVEKLSEIIGAKKQEHDAFVDKLFGGAASDSRHLREFLRHVSVRNRDGRTVRVLSVTNSAGFVLSEDQFAHRVASIDLSNYKLIERGQYAYNPSRINVGSIARLDAWECGALSPMYVVFSIREKLNSDYFFHWLSSAEARQRIRLAAQGSVRETVNFDDLGSILIPVPPIERQKAISNALNASRCEITLLRRLRDMVTKQKRGLMQKLLTGEWRVPVRDGDVDAMASRVAAEAAQ